MMHQFLCLMQIIMATMIRADIPINPVDEGPNNV